MPTTTKHHPPLTLGEAGTYPINLVEENGQWRVRVDLANTMPQSQLIKNLHAELTLEANGASIQPLETFDEAKKRNKCLTFALPEPLTGPVKLTMRGQPVSEFTVDTAHPHLMPTAQHRLYQLAISETRALGMKLDAQTLAKLPYDRAQRIGYDPKIHAPITDVHTHYSAQIKAEDLFLAAFDADAKAKAEGGERIAYPVELLRLLGVEPDKMRLDEKQQVPVPMVPREFNPMRDEGLACEQKDGKPEGIYITDLSDRQRDAIIQKMRIGPDDTMAFSNFDREMYRYRNPFVKHPELAKPILKKIAEDYAAMGIQYAELSTGAMTDPEWFRAMTEAVEEIDRDGVGPDHKKMTMRFLVGLPRNSKPQETMIALERVKYLARHPYIVGVDLLGYESNKTRDFHWALAHLAQWAQSSENTDLNPKDGWDFQRDFIIRAHAGETAKNPENVGDAVRIAQKYKVRVRIGHALHWIKNNELTKMLQDLSKHADKDPIASERCADANQAYRTEELVHQQPAMLDAPKFLGSDGGGALIGTPTGLAYSMLAAGTTLEQLAEIRCFEEGYIARQAARETLKQQAFETRYGAGRTGLEAFLDGYKKHMKAIPTEAVQLEHYLPKQFEDKTPLLIGGASGSSWEKMDRKDQQVVERAAEFMLRSFDPAKTYFVLGRVQNKGVGQVFDKAILKYNHDHPTNKFAVLGRYHGASKEPSGGIAESVSWIQDIPGARDRIPGSMIAFCEDKKGKSFFFEGSDFTKEMAGLARDRELPFALQVPTKGDFRKVAITTSTTSQFTSFQNFVEEAFIHTGPTKLFASEKDLAGLLLPGVALDKIQKDVERITLQSDTAVARLVK